jgi:hypothetical protein
MLDALRGLYALRRRGRRPDPGLFGKADIFLPSSRTYGILLEAASGASIVAQRPILYSYIKYYVVSMRSATAGGKAPQTFEIAQNGDANVPAGRPGSPQS